jgi:hypothetical protein
VPNAGFEPTTSTAAAAQLVKEWTDPKIKVAAITSVLAARDCELVTLAGPIQDARKNTTRFIILGREPLQASAHTDKCTLALFLQDRLGAIRDAFTIIAGYEVDVRSLKILPAKDSEVVPNWKDWFFVDVVSANGRGAILKAERQLRTRKDLFLTVRELGFYPNEEPGAPPSPAGTVDDPREPSLHTGGQPTLRELIRAGEGPNLEFKSSLRWSIKDGRVDKALEAVVVKTIAAFFNSGGGRLLIGVDDAGGVVGLSPDYLTLQKQSRDGFELHLRNKIQSAVDTDLVHLIDVRFLSEAENDVCLVTVPRSPRPVWIKESGEPELFVRNGNQTQRLDKKGTADFIGHHWH